MWVKKEGKIMIEIEAPYVIAALPAMPHLVPKGRG